MRPFALDRLGLQGGSDQLQGSDVGHLDQQTANHATRRMGQVVSQTVPHAAARRRHGLLDGLRAPLQRSFKERLLQRLAMGAEQGADVLSSGGGRVDAQPRRASPVRKAAGQVGVPVGQHRRHGVDHQPQFVPAGGQRLVGLLQLSQRGPGLKQSRRGMGQLPQQVPLAVIQPAWLAVDDTQGAERRSAVDAQGHAGVEADVRCPNDHRMVEEALVQPCVRYFEQVLAQHRMGTEGQLAGRLADA
jgi:hypothetical protein